MKNTITISYTIAETAIAVQIGETVHKTYKDLLDKSNDTLAIDKDLLLELICRDLNYDIDWKENIVTTNNGSYNKEEFLIKLISNGRRALKGLETYRPL